MEFDNCKVRRQDRLLDENAALKLLAEGEYGFLSFSTNDGGYGIPMSYVFEGESIYFHCAPDGQKLDNIAANNMVSFCVVGSTRILADKFTTLYQSVIAKGKIEVVMEDEERKHGLTLLIEKYSPDHKGIGAKYMLSSLPRTAVLRLAIEKLSGKCK